jgi:hypothetical protein
MRRPQNFVVNATEAQIVELLTDSSGRPTALGDQLEQLDTFFTVVFALEILVNAYAHWFV